MTNFIYKLCFAARPPKNVVDTALDVLPEITVPFLWALVSIAVKKWLVSDLYSEIGEQFGLPS